MSIPVAGAVRFSTQQHDSFPLFGEDELIKFVQVMIKQEYFVGQHIITQNEVGDDYFVLRRGRCDVLVDHQQVGMIEFGMGFGELALVCRLQHRWPFVSIY